jgi:hypothetical protein
MKKRTGAVALTAMFTVAAMVGSARAADPVTPTATPNTATAAPVPAEPTPPTSILNDVAFDRIGLKKPLDNMGIKVGSYVEGSYTYNFRSPRNDINEGRVFDFEHDAPRLNQIALQIARSVDAAASAKAGKYDLGFGIDMMYGSDGRLVHSNGLAGYNSATHPINQYDLTQAYVDLIVPVGNGLDIKAGKFVTPFGVETIAPVATVTGSSGNALYSHSYSFGFGIPFTHTGVIATYALNDKISLTGGFTRGWEQSTKDNNGSIDFLGSMAYTFSDEVKLTVNASVGPQQAHNSSRYRYDFEGILAYTPKKSDWTFAGDGVFAWEDHAALSGSRAYWYGVTGYAGYKVCDMVTVNGRAEWFRDDGGSRLGVNGSFYEGTVGLTIKPFYKDKIGANFEIRPELRGDYSNAHAFGSGNHKTQATAAIDAIFSF